jgi:hypothetical protein
MTIFIKALMGEQWKAISTAVGLIGMEKDDEISLMETTTLSQ